MARRTSLNRKNRLGSVDKLRISRKKRIYEGIVAQIRVLIEKGQLKAGDKIPPERELADIFNVSRDSVRDAIRTLEENLILMRRHGDGTYILSDNQTAIVELLAGAIQHEKNKLSEIFQFRRLVEPQIALLAAKNATDQDIKDLEMLVHQQKQEINEAKKATEFDSAFHLLLARASKNSVYLRIIEALNDILGETRAEALQSESRRLKSLEGHQAIATEVKQRRLSSAKKAMTQHLRVIELIVLEHGTRPVLDE